ncbi:hypothetical protein ASD52_36395 [Ensifer sp. Root142]|nr:hypothetical protein ASD52_36395 [Ensifer sp. Root142]
MTTTFWLSGSFAELYQRKTQAELATKIAGALLEICGRRLQPVIDLDPFAFERLVMILDKRG